MLKDDGDFMVKIVSGDYVMEIYLYMFFILKLVLWIVVCVCVSPQLCLSKTIIAS